MPKSKRNKIVHLTQVKKKSKDHKDDLMKTVTQYLAQFSKIYIFDFDSTKSDRIMLLRVRLKEYGRIFAGRNAVLNACLKDVSTKSGTNYDDLIKQITGHRGLLFTDISIDKLISIIEKEVPEFRKKLLGYAQIKPEVRDMEVESKDDVDDDDADLDMNEVDSDEIKKKKKIQSKKKIGIKKKSMEKKIEQTMKGAEKKKEKKAKKEKAINMAHEVKFVRI